LTPSPVEQYLSGLPADKRAALERLRGIITEAFPGAEECISYRMPAFRLRGRVLVAYGARRGHCALYPMSSGIVEAFSEELGGFETSRGTIRFQPDNPLPRDLLVRMVEARVLENGV
jgi:uncharacterized protein YdhG (YjbR/CyaY superfamily)